MALNVAGDRIACAHLYATLFMVVITPYLAQGLGHVTYTTLPALTTLNSLKRGSLIINPMCPQQVHMIFYEDIVIS